MVVQDGLLRSLVRYEEHLALVVKSRMEVGSLLLGRNVQKTG